MEPLQEPLKEPLKEPFWVVGGSGAGEALSAHRSALESLEERQRMQATFS